jgi:3'-phosphoadenosine 5'-phosphosulfate sulfotransferase (PAPS reductase)/FAD synthetase
MPLRVLSLGGGVQSTTLLLMSLEGEWERPDYVVFADTHAEPAAVYAHLADLERRCRNAGLPFVRVTAGDLRSDALQYAQTGAGPWPGIPVYLGSGGALRRACTDRYKLRPIHRWLRERVGPRPRAGAVEVWLGITLDEPHRARDSDVAWIRNRYPLLDLRMTRADCLRWLQQHGYPRPPSSGCLMCPYHSDAAWRALRDTDPGSWEQCYLHRSLRPLPDVDLRTRLEKGERSLFDLAPDGWGNECAGLCGT